MTDDNSYSGFMPMIRQITVSNSTAMLNTEGELIHAHSFVVNTRENKDFVFSVTQEDLTKLYFLIGKVLSA
jgi:hypothetical protein